MESVREKIIEILECHRMYPDNIEAPPDILADKIIALVTKDVLHDIACMVVRKHSQ
jgi:hypothetical protein